MLNFNDLESMTQLMLIMRALEGDSFLSDEKMKELAGVYNWVGYWKLKLQKNPDDSDLRESAEFDVRVIYGSGGWNRYFFHGNGKIRFSKFHASSDTLKKLESLNLPIEVS